MNVYPVTIISDRYDGTYSGGAWLAFNLDPEDVPEDVSGDDIACMMFWEHHEQMQGGEGAMPIGVGSSPDAALFDLYRKVKAQRR